MSKKSGLFFNVIAGIKRAFGVHDYHGLPATTESEKQIAKNHPKGKRHRTFGKEITSFGEKPNYGHLPRKRFYQEKIDAKRREHEATVWELNQEGIIWTPMKLYWKDRKLAELHQN
jgi:hypothetical protein